jgi:hypothetical protein
MPSVTGMHMYMGNSDTVLQATGRSQLTANCSQLTAHSRLPLKVWTTSKSPKPAKVTPPMRSAQAQNCRPRTISYATFMPAPTGGETQQHGVHWPPAAIPGCMGASTATVLTAHRQPVKGPVTRCGHASAPSSKQRWTAAAHIPSMCCPATV